MSTKATMGGLLAVAVTVASGTVAFAASAPNVNVNASCQGPMNLDITYPEAPTGEWTIVVKIPGEPDHVLLDQDSDLMGFHPQIPAGELPDVNYTYTVDAYLGDEYFAGVFSGSVVCTTEPPPPSPSPDPSPSSSVQPTSTASPDPDPTTGPTTDPTTEPTTEPTTDPTTEPTASPDPDPTTDPQTVDPDTSDPGTAGVLDDAATADPATPENGTPSFTG